MLDKKTEMKDLMAKGYDKEIDFHYKDITNHYHCKNSPCILPLDHDNLEIFLLSACHDKASPAATPLAPCQKVQENHAKNALDNFQIRHQLPHLRSQNLKPDSFQVFQRKYHCVL